MLGQGALGQWALGQPEDETSDVLPAFARFSWAEPVSTIFLSTPFVNVEFALSAQSNIDCTGPSVAVGWANG